jgi:hypothetical protein
MKANSHSAGQRGLRMKLINGSPSGAACIFKANA